jgi:hypothetical protein
MKYIPIIAVILVRQSATIFFMRVVGRDLFLSVGLSASLALAFSLLLHFIERRIAARKKSL